VRDGSERTSLSSAIDNSTWLLDRFPDKAAAKIIDLSCNGTNNDGAPVQASHDRALAKGYVINAIAVVDSWKQRPADLLGYLAEEIIGGNGAFVTISGRPQDYATALRRKLVMEVSWTMSHEEEDDREVRRAGK
jgi:PAS domain-containing protein